VAPTFLQMIQCISRGYQESQIKTHKIQLPTSVLTFHSRDFNCINLSDKTSKFSTITIFLFVHVYEMVHIELVGTFMNCNASLYTISYA
jgi:hypothetical protein